MGNHVVGQIAASQVQPKNGMGQRVALVNWDCVGDTIPRVHDNTSGTTGGIQGKYSLDGHIHSGNVKGLEHYLGHLFPVSLRVERGFGKEDRVLLGCYPELIIKGVVPNFLHIIPVGDNAVLNGVLEEQDTPFGLSLVSYEAVLVSHANHDTLVLWPPDNRREDTSGGVITSHASLAHS